MATDGNAIRLVVNADGFGATTAISRGIVRAHREGIVTSTSILGNCADPVAVKKMLDDVPNLGVGVHLTLTDGRPVSNPTAIHSLVGTDGQLARNAGDLVLSWAQGILREDDIQRELDAQVGRLRDVGLRLDHLDTRAHVGFLPAIGRAVEAVARHHGIPGIRMGIEKPTLGWVVEAPRGVMAAALGSLAWVTRRKMGALRHGPRTWGFVESGRLDEVRILEILGRLTPGIHELVCHPAETSGPPPRPGERDPARELRALTSPLVREAMAGRSIELCRWSDLF